MASGLGFASDPGIRGGSPIRPRRLLFGTVLALLLGCGGRDAPRGGRAYDPDGRLLVERPRPAHLPNLLVIVLDAVRADALPPLNETSESPTRMPFYASLADRGVRFTNASSAASWTLPSMMSLLTGLLPSDHGQVDLVADWSMPAAVTTFAEVLSAGYGYETAAFVNGNWFKRSGDSLLQGFATRSPMFALRDVSGRVRRWNRDRDKARPFFLVLHTYEAHDPYGERNHPWPPVPIEHRTIDPALLAEGADPAEVFRRCYLDADTSMELGLTWGPRLGSLLQRYKFRGYAEHPRPDIAAELEAAYWNGVSWVDGLLERAWTELEHDGLLDDTLVVVTADHGEAFGTHGNLAHGLYLYDELVHVPLVMIGPPPFSGGRLVTEEVGLVDVLPTFLDWAGLAPLEPSNGRSARSLVEGGSWCRPVVSEERLTSTSTGTPVDAWRISARTERWKYIATFHLDTGHVAEEAYDLWFDPDERDDLAKGTGLLPSEQVFDPCLCAAMEAVRGRIWHTVAGDDAAPLPDVAAPGGAGPRPTPCRSTP